MKTELLAAAVLIGLGALCAAGEIKINTTEVDGRLVDDINLPFVNDPALPGRWDSVDFVRDPADFKPGVKLFEGDLYLKKLVFLEGGRTAAPWWTWTKGVVMHSGDRTAARYIIKKLNGATYMFFEWKSGDYSFKHRKPEYYVLKKS